MASSPDMRLQLIVEAVNRSEAVLNKVKKDLVEIQAETVAVTAASARAGQAMAGSGAAGTNAMKGMGPAVAAARDHLAAAQKEMPGLLQKLTELRAQYDGIGLVGAAAGQRLEEAGKKGAAAMDHVHDQAHRAHSMLGQMVQMAIILGSVAFVQKLVDMGVSYNKALEISELGISAIMTSMGVITDQQGRVVQGQEKWNASQQLSLEAQRELQKIAMMTPASYEELVQAYQGMEAPSLSAKINFQDSLELTGLLTNAVKAMGLPMQQIVQEGRDMVSGTIDMNSQLARSLQITNEDVKAWREKGTVFPEIKKRLEGFIYASKEFEDTWEGAWSNFRDIAQRALGEGSKPLFDFIKGEVKRLSLDMVNITRDASGNIIDVQIKPEVISRIRQLSEDLKKLVQILELTVKWGEKLATPAMYTAVFLGIGRITLAIEGLYKAIKAGETIAKGGLLMRLLGNPTALAVAAAALGIGYSANKMYDSAQLSKRADDVRRQLGQDGKSLNADQFQGPQLSEVLEKFPTATNEDVAKMIREGAVKLSAPDFADRYTAAAYKIHIDQAKAQRVMEPADSGYNVAGTSTKSPEQLKKEREAFISALDDSYAESAGKFRTGEAKEAEAIKTGLKEKELAWQQGLITQEEYLQARAELERKGHVQILNSIGRQQVELTKRYQEQAAQVEDPKQASDLHKGYVAEWYRLEADYEKQSAELKRSGFDEELRHLDESKKLETARREGVLKLLQEQLAGEKAVTQELLEREKITPLEAQKRTIGLEQRGLEAEYWDVTARLLAKGNTADQAEELRGQLQLLEQKMQNLDAAAPGRLYRAGKETASLEAKREEARISHELARLDEQEMTRQVGKTTALQRRKELLEQLLASQKLDQASIDPSDTTAWNSQQAAIDATGQKLLEVKRSMRDLSDDMAGGLSEGLRQYLDQTTGTFGQMVELSKSTAAAMEGAFSDFFFDAMQGKLKSFGDYVNSFLQSVERAIANVMAQKVAVSTLGAFGFSTQALGGVWEGGVQKFATGGVVLQPTLFPTSSGVGLMGEAGPEAIMPLARSASGHLGVRAVGKSGDPNVNVGGITVEGGPSGVDASHAAELGRLVQGAITQALIKEKRPGGLLS